jgi:hypothetical protein
VELRDGDAVRVGPGETEVAQGAGGEPGRPLERFVDAVLVEERLRGVGEQVGFGGQDPPAEALVLLALRSGGRCEVRVGEVRRRARQGVEDPALGVRGIGGRGPVEARVVRRRSRP